LQGHIGELQLPPQHESEDGRCQEQPGEKSCWRFTFRFHQEESKETNGFMIQVQEMDGLGDGQKLETELAREVGLKVFRTYTNECFLRKYGMLKISKAVKDW